jgi:hypothetical protein
MTTPTFLNLAILLILSESIFPLLTPGVGLIVLLHQVVQVEMRITPGGGDGGMAQ